MHSAEGTRAPGALVTLDLAAACILAPVGGLTQGRVEVRTLGQAGAPTPVRAAAPTPAPVAVLTLVRAAALILALEAARTPGPAAARTRAQEVLATMGLAVATATPGTDPHLIVVSVRHSTGTPFSSPGSVIPSGWRPSRIASTMSGASSVSRSSRLT